MPTPTSPDIRQSQTRVLQDQLDSAAVVQMDSVLASINNELTPPGRLIAASTPSLVVTVGTGTVVNPNTSKNRLIPFISNTYVNFAGGTITFPSGSGTITVSPGVNLAITIGASQFMAITVQLDSTGLINLSAGTAAASAALALAAASPGSSSFLSLGLIVIQTNAGSVIQSITNAFLWQFGSGTGGSGSGSSGLGDDLASTLFRGDIADTFPESPTQSSSTVNSASTFTNATYNAGKTMYAISYDASKTGTSAGTAFTLSGTPAYTVVAGDVVVNQATGEVKKITVVTTQTAYTLESAFAANMAAGAATVSQAVHTKDVYNLAVDSNGNTLASAFPGLTFSEVAVFYKDNQTAGSNQWAIDTAANVSYVGSPDNSAWTIKQSRVTNVTDTYQSTILSSAGTSLYLRFFAAKTSGSGVVNLIMYKAYVQKSSTVSGGTGALNSAYAFTNNVGTPFNCVLSVVGGKTTITLTSFSYAVGVGAGAPYGSIDVYLNGQLIPRFINSTLTPDASYTETSGTVITLDRDYEFQNISVEIIQRTSIVDASTSNTTALSALQDQDLNGFQGFTNQSNLMVATTTAGAPVNGTFYSAITQRSSMVDLTQDLKPRMGIDRMEFGQPVLIQGEYGASGEFVWSVLNDTFNQVRLVGNWSSAIIATGTNGVALRASTTTDYIEVTFYGTGLNLLVDYTNFLFSSSYAVDGGSNVTITGSAGAPFLHTRNYSVNQVLPIVSNLTLGVHTVRVNVSTSDIYGCEILNESSSLKINSGVSYLAGKKLVSSAQTVVSPSTTFESGTLGTAGGKVVVYQKADGTIAKAVQPTGGQANLASASHALEEVSRTYWFREFGAGRNDDYSGNGSSGNYAFTLDDGTTTLLGSSVRFGTTSTLSEVVQLGANGSFLTFIFVGSGLDVVRQDDGTGTDSYQYFVDGTSIGTVNTSTSGPKTVEKVVSGLPYGTHTVKLIRNSATNSSRGISRFIVYHPKKPAIPAGAVELADYNVMANFSANSTANGLNLSSGILRKTCTREFTYVNGTGGTQDWAAEGPQAGSSGGNQMDTTRTNAFFEYTFFGTGFDFRYSADTNRSASITVSLQSLTTGGSLQTLNSTNFPGLTTSSYGSTFTYASGNLTQVAGATTPGCGMVVSGLTLGTYKVRFNNNTASAFLTVESFDIITPIHSAKTNLYGDLQNTLPIGSQGVSDNRKTTPVKDILPVSKQWVQAFGISGDPTTTTNAAIPMPDMFLVIRTFGNPIEATYSVEIQNTSTGNNSFTFLYVDGQQVGVQKDCNTPTAGARFQTNDSQIIPVAPGVHTVAVYWTAAAGTLSATSTRRNMKAREI